jgi:hypothetical protein
MVSAVAPGNHSNNNLTYGFGAESGIGLLSPSTLGTTKTGFAPGFGTGIPTNDVPSRSHHVDHIQSSHSGIHGYQLSSATRRLPTMRHSGPNTLTTVPVFLNHAERAAEIADLAAAKSTFEDASNGANKDGVDVITMDGYLAYFKVDDLIRETAYGRNVVAKFHLHDTNGDGVLTFEETQLLCDADGCIPA